MRCFVPVDGPPCTPRTSLLRPVSTSGIDRAVASVQPGSPVDLANDTLCAFVPFRVSQKLAGASLLIFANKQDLVRGAV